MLKSELGESVRALGALRGRLRELFGGIKETHTEVQQMMSENWVAELPAVYQQHKLEPLCERKVVVCVTSFNYESVTYLFRWSHGADGQLAMQ